MDAVESPASAPKLCGCLCGSG